MKEKEQHVLPLAGGFEIEDWKSALVQIFKGQRGEAHSKTYIYGDVRVRKVQYFPGYMADHWCRKGHVLLVLDGELVTELEDGIERVLTSGMSYVVPDGVMGHRSRSDVGALLFIVD